MDAGGAINQESDSDKHLLCCCIQMQQLNHLKLSAPPPTSLSSPPKHSTHHHHHHTVKLYWLAISERAGAAIWRQERRLRSWWRQRPSLSQSSRCRDVGGVWVARRAAHPPSSSSSSSSSSSFSFLASRDQRRRKDNVEESMASSAACRGTRSAGVPASAGRPHAYIPAAPGRFTGGGGLCPPPRCPPA